MSLIRGRISVNCVGFGALLSVLGLTIPVHGQRTELDPLVGRDLWKEPPTQEEQSRLQQMVGEVPTGVFLSPVPWHIWKTSLNSATRYVILIGEPEMMVPGSSSARVLLLDSGLKRVNAWSFQTGWRIDLEKATFEFSRELGTEVIVLHMARFINGRNVSKEYYALNGDQLQFVRMESDQGKAVQNEYVFPNYEIGFAPPYRTEDEWLAKLQSPQKADVLSALVFLGGRHITEPQRHFSSEPSESKYGAFFEELIGSPRIRQAIAALSKSDDAWVRQAALLAIRGPRERPLN